MVSSFYGCIRVHRLARLVRRKQKNNMMKTNFLKPGILAGAFFLVAGCNRPADQGNTGTNALVTSDSQSTASNSWQSTKEAGSNSWEAVRTAATNAWEGTKEGGSNVWQKTKDALGADVATNEVSTNYFGYDFSMKDAFVGEAKMSLAEADQSASNLTIHVAAASDGTKADLQQTLQKIKDQRADLGEKYEAIKNASEGDWNDSKAAFGKSYHDLKADLKAGWDSVSGKL